MKLCIGIIHITQIYSKLFHLNGLILLKQTHLYVGRPNGISLMQFNIISYYIIRLQNMGIYHTYVHTRNIRVNAIFNKNN